MISMTTIYNKSITVYDNHKKDISLDTSGNQDVFIAKYSDSGIVQWATRISGSDPKLSYSITNDTNNNVYVTGSYNNSTITIYDTNGYGQTTLDSSGNNDVFIVKYSDTGYTQWATRISGSGFESGTSIVTDTANNIYVTGGYDAPITIYDTNGYGHTTLDTSGNEDVFILKYSHTGYAQWATHISGIGFENGTSIVTDTSNNIYVTGSYDAPITIYDTNGYGHTTLGSSGNFDVFIVKYNNTGYAQWATRISGIGTEIGNSIATDTSNNIYVTGGYTGPITIYHTNGVGHTTLGNSGNNDVFIVKYSDTGYTQWATRISGVGNEDGNSIVTDTANNIYVTGGYDAPITIYDTNGYGHTTLVNLGGNDAFIVKYSHTGYTQWATRISGIGYENSTSIVTDTSNNVYVTGGYDAPITIYDINGNGTTMNNILNEDAFIVKYSHTGYSQWSTHISGLGTEFGSSITNDTGNNIYVTGVYTEPITFHDTNINTEDIILNNILNEDAFIVKYSDTGYVQWATHISGVGFEIGTSITTDTSNNIYVTGNYNSPIIIYDTNDVGHTILYNISQISDVFIVKYSNNGYAQWETRISGVGNNVVNSIVTDTENNIYVTGAYNNSPVSVYDTNGNTHATLGNSGNNDAFIVKYSDTGYAQWSTRISGIGNEIGNSIVTDTSNNIYVTGGYTGPITIYDTNGVGHTTLGSSGNDDVFIVKYSDTGYTQWATRISSAGFEYGYSIATDTANNIYVTGMYRSRVTVYNTNGNGNTTLVNSGDADAFIVKYNDTGYVQWATRISGIGFEYGYSITTDMENNIYVTGGYTGLINIYDTNNKSNIKLNSLGNVSVFIVKYNNSGYAQWATRISGSEFEYGNSITTDIENNIYVTGGYTESINIYNTNNGGHTTLNSAGNKDVYIVKYNNKGYIQWVTNISGSGDEVGNSITNDMLNNIYVTGRYNSQITFYNAGELNIPTVTEFLTYLNYKKPSFSFSEQTTSSDRMNKLKNQTQYAFFKKNGININNCNLPLTNTSYQYKYDITKGNMLCNIMKK